MANLNRLSSQPELTTVDRIAKLLDIDVKDLLNNTEYYCINLKDIVLSSNLNGLYTFAVGIVDTTKDNAIGIFISARDEYQTADGWVKIHDISIH